MEAYATHRQKIVGNSHSKLMGQEISEILTLRPHDAKDIEVLQFLFCKLCQCAFKYSDILKSVLFESVNLYVCLIKFFNKDNSF